MGISVSRFCHGNPIGMGMDIYTAGLSIIMHSAALSRGQLAEPEIVE